MLSSKPLVIVLIGPTASGKTKLAIDIAKYFNINIHNVDSRQLYRFMDIGTAKPTKTQQKKIKHFLIDIEEPSTQVNARQFQKIATKSINQELSQNRIPFLVGGSGLYMNSIIKGFFTPNVPPQKALRSQFEKLGQAKCWELLKSCDPELTQNINIEDAIELTTTKTVQFAKRQKTWFRNKNNPIWLNNKNLLKDAIINIESALR